MLKIDYKNLSTRDYKITFDDDGSGELVRKQGEHEDQLLAMWGNYKDREHLARFIVMAMAADCVTINNQNQKRIAELEAENARLTNVVNTAHVHCINAIDELRKIPHNIGYDAAVEIHITIDELETVEMTDVVLEAEQDD